MDIILATNTHDPFLALEGIERYADGSGFGCQLHIRSGWLTASYRFYFEVEPAGRFISSLIELDRTLKGEAVLKPEWEQPYLRLGGDGKGRIGVSGELIDLNQRVVFCFATDQTCLRPFISALQAMLAEPVA